MGMGERVDKTAHTRLRVVIASCRLSVRRLIDTAGGGRLRLLVREFERARAPTHHLLPTIVVILRRLRPVHIGGRLLIALHRLVAGACATRRQRRVN